MHPVIELAQRKLGYFGRIDCSVNSLLINNGPDDKQIQIHSILNSSAILVVVCKRIVRNIGKEQGEIKFLEEWIPEEYYRFFPRKEKNKEKGTVVFTNKERNWRDCEYSPSEISEIEQKLEHLEYLIRKSKIQKTYD